MIHDTIKDSVINQGLVFFGGYASSLYGKYMPYKKRKNLLKVPDFDILSEDAKTSATIIKEQLQSVGVKDIKLKEKNKIGENIPPHIEIVVGSDTVCFIYEPIACHSYNQIYIHGKYIKVATIDTMLSFFLAFLYTNKPYYDTNRIICMAQYLFQVQSRNRLQQKGMLKRFTTTCYGRQKTLEDSRAEKANAYALLKSKKGSKEYEEYFLRYIPSEINERKQYKKTKKRKYNKKRKTRRN